MMCVAPIVGGRSPTVPAERGRPERRWWSAISGTGSARGNIPPDFPVAARAVQVTDLARGLTMRALIGAAQGNSSKRLRKRPTWCSCRGVVRRNEISAPQEPPNSWPASRHVGYLYPAIMWPETVPFRRKRENSKKTALAGAARTGTRKINTKCKGKISSKVQEPRPWKRRVRHPASERSVRRDATSSCDLLGCLRRREIPRLRSE